MAGQYDVILKKIVLCYLVYYKALQVFHIFYMPTSCYPLTFRGSLIEREGWAKNRLKDLNLNKNSLKPSQDLISSVVKV